MPEPSMFALAIFAGTPLSVPWSVQYNFLQQTLSDLLAKLAGEVSGPESLEHMLKTSSSVSQILQHMLNRAHIESNHNEKELI